MARPRGGRRTAAGALALAAALWAAPATASQVPVCEPGGDPIEISGEEQQEDEGSYRLLAFDVVAPTSRVEVSYDWGDQGIVPGTSLTSSTVDLGLWDEDGPDRAEGFRGWSGSRHRQVHVQADEAERGYLAAPIRPGTWHVELGIAAVAPEGTWWEVTISCDAEAPRAPVRGTPALPDPVDPSHVARAEAGWYHGDLHMHGYHSHPDAPDWERFVAFAREQQLDFLPVTEYVTSAHWYELGAVQRANPDLVIWPGREVITYEGHAIVLNETWDHIEYRHGHRDIDMGDIQRESVARGALFQVAHPTTFEGPLFEDFCRGCSYEVDDVTDWSAVHTLEVVTGPIVVRPGGDPRAPGFENPFTQQAIDLWEDKLNRGFRITAVGGSDDKWAGQRREPTGTVSPHGVPATAVHAEELSRAGLIDAVLAGRAYVRTRGVADSPSLELQARSPDGTTGTFGDVFHADEVEVTITVGGGQGQVLTLVRNGDERGAVPVTSDPFEHTFTADRASSEGPLGTWWRVETRDHESRTTIGNPIFLADAADPAGGGDAADGTDGRTGPSEPRGRSLPSTGGGGLLAGATAVAAAAALRGRTPK